MIDILKSMLQSSNNDYRNSTVQKLIKSQTFGPQIQDSVVVKFSNQFSKFLAANDCPLRSGNFFSDQNQIEALNLGDVLDKCYNNCPKMVSAVSQILCLVSDDGRCNKQRLLTILMIGAYSQNQQINLLPKLIGEFLKRKNCSKQGLELLQRCGVTLVSKSVSREQDKIGERSWVRLRKEGEKLKIGL